MSFFPLDLPLAEFVAVYLVLGTVLLLAGKGAALGVTGLLEPKADASQDRRVDGPRLVEGELPTDDGLVAAAYLRGGIQGAADAILASAAGEAWMLKDDEAGGLELFDPPVGASLRSAKLRGRISGPHASFRDARLAALEVAKDESFWIRRTLSSQNLLRSAGSWFLGALIFGAFLAIVVGLGAVRAANADANGESPLVALSVACFFLFVAGALSKTNRATGAGERYVSWLESSTDALRDDVASARATDAGDLALVGAVHGVAEIPVFRKCIDELAAEAAA